MYNINLQNSGASSAIQYSGQVNVRVMDGNRVIQTRTVHNGPGEAMYTFLFKALLDTLIDKTSKEVLVLPPTHIKLFSFIDVDPPEIPKDIIENSTPISGGIPLNQGAVAIHGPNERLDPEDNSHWITLHATVPCSYLDSGGANEIKIHQIGLYAADSLADEQKQNYFACADFVNEQGTWAPIVVSDTRGDYNIFIEWTLRLL